MSSTLKRRGLLWPTVMTVLGLAVLLSLGTWQMRRLAWKEAMIAAVDARAAEAPLTHDAALKLQCDTADRGVERSCEFRRVRLRGTFDHAGERHIFAGVVGKGGQASVGYWVFTPFMIEGAQSSNERILVNRGFVPEAAQDPAKRQSGQTEGPTEIVAQIRTRERRGMFDAANDEKRNVYYVRDPAELGVADVLGKMPGPAPLTVGTFYLEQMGDPPAGGYPRPLAGKPEFPNRHLEYALTWYGLAVTLLGVFLAYARSRRRAVG